MPICNLKINFTVPDNKYIIQRLQQNNIFCNVNDNIELSLEFLKKIISHSVPVKVDFICDQCNKKGSIKLQKITLTEIKDNYIICSACKARKTNLERYGVTNPSQRELVKQKKIKTLQSHYGDQYTNILQIPEIREKIKQTNLLKYNVENPSYSDEIKQKISQRYHEKTDEEKQQINKKRENTNLQRYNVKYLHQSSIFQEKYRQTNLQRFGVEYPSQSQQIHNKMQQTLYKNNTAPTSIQQQYFYHILQEKEVDKNNIKINYPFSHLLLDIVLINEKINIEYNGGGHNLGVKLGSCTIHDFNIKEIKRSRFIRSQGWKQIFIISPHDKIKNYTDEEYIKMIYMAKQYLLHTSHHWVNIYIEEDQFETSVYTQTINNILII